MKILKNKTIMKVKLTRKESINYFYNALCNGLGYVSAYGLEIEYSPDDYSMAKRNLKIESVCFEDVLIEILKTGGTLSLIDTEAEETFSIKLNDVFERVQTTPLCHLMDMKNEMDDAVTADVILQTVFLNDVIFG